jgi:glycosyltransferase involved in cell wall biosynthesis
MPDHVLLVSHTAIRGGAATMVANTASALLAGGFQVTLACPAGDGLDALRRTGAEVQVLPRFLPNFRHTTALSDFALHPRSVQGYLDFRRKRTFWAEYFRDSRADVVALCSLILAPMAEAVCHANLPAVCLVQETQAPGLLGLRNAWLRRLLSEKTVGVCFISEFDRCVWKLKSPIQEVIPNWLDLSAFGRNINRYEARCRLGLSIEHQAVLFLGGIEEIKGTLPLIRAVQELKDFDGLRLVIAGYGRAPARTGFPSTFHLLSNLRQAFCGDYRKQVLALLNDPQLSCKLIMTGPLDDVGPLYAAADLVVFPAVRPHQSRPILEAGAFNLPVVASDFACIREFVKDGETGLLVQPNNSIALSSAIRKILSDGSLARQLGEGNTQVTRLHHNGLINGPRMAAFFRKILEHPIVLAKKMR